MEKDAVRQAMANYRSRLAALQTEREIISQREKQAYLSLLEESGIGNDEEPPKSSGIADVLRELYQGLKPRKAESVNKTNT